MKPLPNRRRWSYWYASSLPAFIGLGGLGILVLLALSGKLDLAMFGLTSEVSHEGMVAVPTTARTIDAYTKITRDHVWDSQSGNISMVYVPEEQVSPTMMTDLKLILGRVLKKDKAAGYVFTENDFLPQGARHGLVAGIPPGKRAMRVKANKVEGLFGLQRGDRFDLVATLPIDVKNAERALKLGGPYGQQLSLNAELSNWHEQATVRILVQNGVLVEPMITRQIPVYVSSLTRGAITKKRPVQEIVIAVDPEEVASLTEALAVGAKISCVPRSGHPDDPASSRTPESQPWSPFSMMMEGGTPNQKNGSSGGYNSLTTVETLYGGSGRSIIAVPSGHNGNTHQP